MFAAALGVTARVAGAAELPLARDLSAEARQAAVDGKVYVILFGAPDCSWCVKVRRNYLAPLNKPTAELKILAREIDIESDERLTDFAGKSISHRAFARARGVRFTPVVVFFDARGDELAESILGMASEDFYGAYLEERLITARDRTIRQPR